MSSTNKTSFLGLSSWLGSDKPQRADFNSDNKLIDDFASEHSSDMQCHLSEEDREKFDLPYYSGVYFGNGNQSQTVITGCPFEPEFGLIFAIGKPSQQTDFSNKASYGYFALAAQRGSMAGISISGKNLIASSPGTAISNTEYPRMNASGTTYFYVLFR